MRKHFSAIALFLFCISFCYSQGGVTQGDAVLKYNKLLVEKSSGDFIRIGPYRVKGTPYLFGGSQNGNIFSKKEPLINTLFSYNLYSNRIELTIKESTEFVIIENALIDSFSLNSSYFEDKYLSDMHFINARVLNQKNDDYLQVLYKGKNVALYKKYTCELGIVSTNYVESDLREFNYGTTYYYQLKNEGKLIKIKQGQSYLLHDFANASSCYKPVAGLEFDYNKDLFLMNFFSQVDNCL